MQKKNMLLLFKKEIKNYYKVTRDLFSLPDSLKDDALYDNFFMSMLYNYHSWKYPFIGEDYYKMMDPWPENEDSFAVFKSWIDISNKGIVPPFRECDSAVPAPAR